MGCTYELGETNINAYKTSIFQEKYDHPKTDETEIYLSVVYSVENIEFLFSVELIFTTALRP
jgi:hypothetical protein